MLNAEIQFPPTSHSHSFHPFTDLVLSGHSYDWVMEFNIYSMGSYSDGGVFTSKPYISGSNYLLKMSNYKAGNWTRQWDYMFWNFILHHKEKIKKIGRLSLLINKATKRIEDLTTD